MYSERYLVSVPFGPNRGEAAVLSSWLALIKHRKTHTLGGLRDTNRADTKISSSRPAEPQPPIVWLKQWTVPVAHAAICHPTLPSLILILSPAQPSPAGPLSHPHKKASCTGGAVEGGTRGDKGREELAELGGAPHRDPLTWFPGPAGQTAQTDSTVSTPCLLLSFISHRDPRGRRIDRGGGWRETQGEGEGGGANEHNEEADTDYADHLPPSLHSSLGTDLSIPYRQAPALSSPPCDPSLVCSLL
ncbi:unnamed protein product [Pleuronectes platessa]|uniref:Uncharacterized protein n=1 Tax=Pleuronectes platessa TaxID=8262 RepID=A0A9N7U9A9_PLEPL|nr:unnamed protein product [Pleuronectes platessa]